MDSGGDEKVSWYAELCCERAQLADGQAILELGCGWGSMALFMAGRYPQSSVTAVSNSRTQKALIDECAKERGLTNLVSCGIAINCETPLLCKSDSAFMG